MGEAKRRQLTVQTQALQAMVVDTPGGRIHVQWDHGASATPNAQLTFFAEFLATTGVYDAWVDGCPLIYTSPNAPSKHDVLGTWLLAILADHNRYAHITGMRGCAALGHHHMIKQCDLYAGPVPMALSQAALVRAREIAHIASMPNSCTFLAEAPASSTSPAMRVASLTGAVSEAAMRLTRSLA